MSTESGAASGDRKPDGVGSPRLEPRTPAEALPPARDHDDPRAEIERVLRRLLDRALPVALGLGVVALCSSALRSLQGSWLPVYSLHALLLTLTLLLYLARNQVGFRTLAGGLCAIAAIDGVGNMLTYGLATNGLLVLGCCCILVSLAFGRRAGFLALGAAIAAWSVIGVLISSHAWPLAPAMQEQLYSPWSWLSQVAAGSLFLFVLVVATYGVKERLIESLRDVRSRGRALERTNATLAAEIAQREQAEASLAEREKRYRLLAENMTDVLFVQDMHLNVVYTSPSTERMFGYSADEISKGRLADWMVPESFEKARAAFGHYVMLAQQGLVDVPLMEYEYVRKDGSRFWGEMRVAFLRGERGELIGSQGSLRDISVRKRVQAEKVDLEARLRQAEKMQAIGQLAGGIAHDFNNQLTGIVMGAELLRREVSSDPELLRYVEFVRTSAARASELTLKLLTFARKDQLVAKPTDMHQIVREVVGILERSVDRAITFDLALEAERHVVLADPSQLQNALLNVALNARDAMPSGGRMELRSAVVTHQSARRSTAGLQVAPGDYWSITIRDDGSGMDEATKARMFEPFFTTKKQGKGTGLGLATVYGAIESHRGGIDVQSEVGKGCAFCIFLPLDGAGQVAPDPSGVGTLPGGTGVILLVEDEPAVRETTCELLEKLGYRVEACADGEQAVQRIRERSGGFDAVVLDLVLPGMSGGGVFREIRKRQPGAPVLVISGYSPDGEAGELLRHPGTRFLQKPFSSDAISSELAILLQGGAAPRGEGQSD